MKYLFSILMLLISVYSYGQVGSNKTNSNVGVNDTCEVRIIAVEQKYDIQRGDGEAGDIYTLLSKFPPVHPDGVGVYGSTFTHIGEATSGTHPSLGFNVTNYNVYSACATSLPVDDSNGHIWLIGAPDDFGTFIFSRRGVDPVCGGGETFCTEIEKIKEKFCDGSERYRYVIPSENSDSLITYEIQGYASNTCPVDPDCGTSASEVMRCATEVTTEASINDFIFTLVTVDCNSVIVSTSSYNFSTGGNEITDIPETSVCADAELKTTCKLDSLDNEFEIREIVSTIDGTTLIELFFDPNNVQYTPVGLVDSWKSCDEIIDFESVCYIIPKVSKTNEAGWIDQDGNIWDCDLGAIIENPRKLDCDCDYTITFERYCTEPSGIQFFLQREIIRDCDEANEQLLYFDDDQITELTQAEIDAILAEDNVFISDESCGELTEYCYYCEREEVSPPPVKSEIKTLSKNISRKKAQVTKKCIYGQEISVLYDQLGNLYSVGGDESITVFDSTGYARVECDVVIKPVEEVCVVQKFIREGEICPSEQFPNGQKVQWWEFIDCYNNVTYEGGADTATYHPWGQWAGGSVGETPPTNNTLGGCDLTEGISSVTQTIGAGCTLDGIYIQGFNHSQVWVNFDANDQIEATFSGGYTVGSGDEMAILTNFSTNHSYTIELLTQAGYTSSNVYTNADMTNIGTGAVAYQFDDNCNTGAGNTSNFLLKISFVDFGIASTDIVSGFRLTFGGSNDDFNGAFITTNALTAIEGGGSLSYSGEVFPLECCPTCDDISNSTVGCATETNAQVALGDNILTVRKENTCTGLLSVTQTNITQDFELLPENNVIAEDCGIEAINIVDCIKDSLDVNWSLVQIINTNNDVVDQFYVNQIDGSKGVPSGLPNSWSDCSIYEGDWEESKFCGYYLGKRLTGRSRTTKLEDGTYATQYFPFGSSDALVNVAEVCCTDECCTANVNTDRNGIGRATEIVYAGISYSNLNSFLDATGGQLVCVESTCHVSQIVICNAESSSFTWEANAIITTVNLNCGGGATSIQETLICADGGDAIRVSKYDIEGTRIDLSFEKPDGTSFIPTTFDDCQPTITTNDVGVGVAWASVEANGSFVGENIASVVQINGNTDQDRYVITFTNPMPNADYVILDSKPSHEPQGDERKNQWIAGSKTVNGFEYILTTDDNGGTEDPQVFHGFDFLVNRKITVLTDFQN